MADSTDLSSGGWITTIVLAISGVVYSIFAFVSGTKSELKVHSKRLDEVEDDARSLRAILDGMAQRTDIERLERKMDMQHDRVTAALLRLREPTGRET